MFDREAAIKTVKASRCPCRRCNGGLTDPKQSPTGWAFCRTCRCAWKVQLVDKTPYAVSIPGTDCPDR